MDNDIMSFNETGDLMVRRRTDGESNKQRAGPCSREVQLQQTKVVVAWLVVETSTVAKPAPTAGDGAPRAFRRTGAGHPIVHVCGATPSRRVRPPACSRLRSGTTRPRRSGGRAASYVLEASSDTVPGPACVRRWQH